MNICTMTVYLLQHGVAMMAEAKMAAAEDSGGGQQQRWRRTTAADNDGSQDWAADYDREGWERTANNDGIKHKGRRRRCCF
jgi:hypothetical protein